MSVKLRKRTLPSGKIQLYLAIGDATHRRYEVVKLSLTSNRDKNKDIMRTAEAFRAKRELELFREDQGLSKPITPEQEFFTFALETISEKSCKTQGTYRNMLSHLQAFHGSRELKFGQMSEKFCEQFKNHLLSTLNPNSALAYFLRLRYIMKAAVKKEIISINPTLEIKIKRRKSLPKYLTESELRRLSTTRCGNNVIRDAFLFSCLCGLRFQDVRDLSWSQIKERGVEVSQSKTGDPLRIPLTIEAEKILGRQKQTIKSGGRSKSEMPKSIFDLPRRSTIDKVLKSWGKRAEVSVRLSFHKARHTFATRLLSSGTDIYTVSKLLGHRDIATTTIYARVVDETKKEAVDRLPNIGI